MNLFCKAFAAAALTFAISAQAADCGERGVVILENSWKFQPATSSNVKPDINDWGETKSATGDWRKQWQLVKRPGKSWKKIGPHKVNSLWYQQNGSIPADWRGRTVMLNFECIEGDAIVFLNGKRIGEVLQPGGEIEVTESVKYGEGNQLRIFLTRDYTDISRGFKEDTLRYLGRTSRFGAIPVHRRPLGFTAPVSLKSYPKNSYISDVFAIPSWRQKKISFQLETKSKQAMKDIVYRATILDAKGKQALIFESKPVKFDAGVSTITIESPWRNPQTWELDRGYLYTAQIEIVQDGKVIDRNPPVTFGFREVWTEGNKLMLNGHPIRLRLTLNCGVSADSLHFFRKLGFNATYTQPHPNSWWRDWNSVTRLNRENLKAFDENGFAYSAPAPNIYHIREKLTNDPAVAAAYEREMNWYMRKYRNHPSILFWAVGMNAYNPRGAISPQGMGRRSSEVSTATMPKVIEKARAIGRSIDPTRLFYSHADGNHGDIATSNMYLNFAPLQEREEWPMQWAQSGNMPYMAVEYGPPYGKNFWKGKRALITENAAMLLGEKAYLAETDAALAKTLEYSVGSKGLTNPVKDMYPAYWDFMRLMVRNTNRAYRTWGFNGGWAHWDFGPFGNPPGFDPKNKSHRFDRYKQVTENFAGMPKWANQGFHIFQQANKPLLAYIAGAPVHTDKTHTYYSGERIDKNVALVWDGPGERKVTGRWMLREYEAGSKPILKKNINTTLEAGDIKLMPVSFKTPNITGKTKFTLELFLSEDGADKLVDSFPLTVFPELKPLKQVSHKVALYDPKGKSADWLSALGLKFVEWKPGDSLEGTELLILGRESLEPGRSMPFTEAQVAAGLKVLVLEQLPLVWKGLGLRHQPVMPRRVFKGVKEHPVFAGLDSEDLINWRGAPDLLPMGKNQAADTRHAPKWTNTHAISSVMLQCPRNVGFTPLLRTSFDLDYTPLLQWQYGKGGIWFSALDLTGRVHVSGSENSPMTDPAASQLARNLLDYIDTYKVETKTPDIYIDGKAETSKLISRLGAGNIKPDADSAELIVVGQGGKLEASYLEKRARAGATVLVLPQPVETYAPFGLKVASENIYRASPVKHPVLAGIGQNLLRWRDELAVPVIKSAPKDTAILGGGVFAVRKLGEGRIVFMQVSPAMMVKKASANKDHLQAVQTSIWRLEQLLAQVLTNLNAPVDIKQAQRLAFLDLGPQYKIIKHWNVLGPFFAEKEDGEKMLAEKFPGEETAIVGDFNPNNLFKRSDGKMLDWRPTVQADEKGFINLGTALKRDTLAVAYGIAVVMSDSKREATLRLGADWRMMAWVNGKPVFKTLHGHNKAGAYKVKVKLKKGENLISVKVASGSKGFGFFADVSSEATDGAVAISEDLKDVSFYAEGRMTDEFDPFEFHYW